MKKYSILNYDGESGNFVYKLSFASSGKTYIGITNNPMRRVRQHVNSSNHPKSKNYHSTLWLSKHLNEGSILLMEILASTPTYEDAQKKEIELISQYRKAGFDMVNILDGGEGALGRVVSQETKDKIAKSLTGKKHTEERRKNISEAHLGQVPWNKGKEVLPHVLEAMLEGQRNRTPEKTKELHDRYRDLYAKDYNLINPKGESIKVRNLKQFSKEHDLSYSSMNKVVNGKLDTHRGWSCTA